MVCVASLTGWIYTQFNRVGPKLFDHIQYITQGVFFLHILYPMITGRVKYTRKTRWGISQNLLSITLLQS